LEELDWEHAESKNHAWEFIKLKGLEEKSVFLAILLRTIGHNLRFGDYVYTRKGSDLLERSSPLIKKKRKESKLFHIEKIFRQPKPKGRVQVLDG